MTKIAGVSMIIGCLLSIGGLAQNVPYPGKESTWKSHQRFDFMFQPDMLAPENDGIPAHVVIPKKALSGKPWVWRARFPDWHTEMDSILLNRGFHIAYVNTDNRFGSPQALEIWDDFYSYLTKTHGWSQKVSLEGVSRGGLFIYGWAKRNPEKVNCIYAEAPVCDFTSWPGGFGTGDGDAASWATLKAEYGFASDQQAQSWNQQPMDNLESLAEAKVPVLHMVGLKDEIVPPHENSLKLIERYVKLGGPATIVPCTQGAQRLQGHHFPVETPQLAADFIQYHTPRPEALLSSSNYHQIRGGIRNSLLKFDREQQGRIAFLGGSITYNGGWRDSLMAYFRKRFPQTKLEFIAAGIPSMGSTPSAFRLQRDVLSKGSVDLLFVEAAVNDDTNGRTSEEQVRAMEGIVRNLRRSNPAADVVMMHFVDPGKMKDYGKGREPEVITNHNKVAEHYQLPTINLAKEVTQRIEKGEFSWEADFKNLHPSPFGQGIYAHSMIEFLERAYSGHIDPDDKISAYSLPEKLDLWCYDQGTLIEASEIKPSKGWELNPMWTPTDDTGTRANYNKVPMMVSKTPGSSIGFKFQGNAVGIAVAAGQDAGMVEYRIDKGAWQTQNLYTRWSQHLHLPWYYTLATGMSPGEHKLEIRISPQKDRQSNGNACRIRYFFVNGGLE